MNPTLCCSNILPQNVLHIFALAYFSDHVSHYDYWRQVQHGVLDLLETELILEAAVYPAVPPAVNTPHREVDAIETVLDIDFFYVK